MKIKDYLKSVRNIQVKIDLLSMFFVFLSILISTITIFLLLESIFYFSPNLKTSVLITALICVIGLALRNITMTNTPKALENSPKSPGKNVDNNDANANGTVTNLGDFDIIIPVKNPIIK